MDAGGRNSCASFYSKSGMLRRGAAIGFCLFSQMWYWFPLIHMFSLTLTPTALIGLTDKLKIPKNFSLKSEAKPSLFAYPEPITPEKKEEQSKAAAAVLSTAAKAKQNKEKDAKDTAKPMDVDADDKKSVADSALEVGSTAGGANASVMATPGTTVIGSTAGSIAPSDLDTTMMDVEEPAEAKKPDDKAADATKDAEMKDKAEGEEKKEEPEPTEEILKNPCRVLPSQQQFIRFSGEIDGQQARYLPLLGEKRRTGFLLLRDQKPEEPEDLFLEDEKKEDDEDPEPEPPAPFEWTADQ